MSAAAPHTPPPPCRRGRPAGSSRPLHADPGRYAVAALDAMQLAGLSQTRALALAAGAFTGQPTPAPLIPASRRGRRRLAMGWGMASFRTSVPVENRASTLLKRAQRATTDEDLAWRSAVAGAIWLALFRQDLPFAQLRDSIRLLCASAGEQEFGDALLASMVARENAPANYFPEFSPLDVA